MKEVEVVFQPFGKRAKFQPGKTTIGEAAKLLKIDLLSMCSHQGTCGKCRVRIDSGYKSCEPLTSAEIAHLTNEEIESNYRLACLVKISEDLTVYVPERSQGGTQRLQTTGIEVLIDPNPLVRKYFVTLPPPNQQDIQSDEDRLLDYLEKKFGLSALEIDNNLISTLPEVLRSLSWKVTITIWKRKIISVEKGDKSTRCFGFAADIGTTKLAGFLLDLITGSTIAVASKINPQVSMGEDIISRITYAVKNGPRGVQDLQRAVTNGINDLIDDCCIKGNIDFEEIFELSFVGNTCMQMNFLGIIPKYLGLAPYSPAIGRGIDLPASSLSLKSHKNANVHFLPVLGGFVGSDALAGILAINMLKLDKQVMVIDIGTNTEIAIGNKDKVMVVSCASGPAFEGMGITHGMKANIGAIERVSINPITFEVNIQTIGNKAPIGICGSGLVDLVAELLKAGIIDLSGKFKDEMANRIDRLIKGSKGWEYIVARKNDKTTGVDITFSQFDIRELQKAKAAMQVGATLLMKKLKIEESEITKLFVAGAFGNYMDPNNARTIGMYPEIPLENIHFIGNSAGAGARMALISNEFREYAEKKRRQIIYYELGTDHDFNNEYIKSLHLPYKELDRYPRTKDLLQKLGQIN